MKKSYPVDKFVVKQKFKAMGLHFLCSVLIFAITVWWLVSTLYPDFHFKLNGGFYGLRVMAGVDLVLGPLLTLLVYHSAKPMREKVMDFAVIGAVQIAALAYGLHTMYMEHPKFLLSFPAENTVTVTQREYNMETDATKMPQDLSRFSTLGGVPLATFHAKIANGKQQSAFEPLTLAHLQDLDKKVRQTMRYEDDKQHLVQLDKQYGQVYVMSVLGKYQGALVALDKDMKMIGVFGQRDLQ
ncbi:hypothetical protein ACKLNO_10540 [Neisseriaceae bacterium B1]